MPYSALYLFIFLPVFMGVYALLPKRRRPLLIAAANICFAALGGISGLVVFAVCLLSAYFSGIVIYNDRTQPDKQRRRKAMLMANILLDSAMLLLFARNAGLAIRPLEGFALAGGAVIPLHLISYLADVYRGSCEAQTSFVSLTAYAAFFPSMQIGPVLKYKRFGKYFREPELSPGRVAEGIKIYTLGLAEYLIIACSLQKVREDMLNVPKNMIGGAAAWLAVLIWYTAFLTALSGMLHMGQGTALMLGFPVRTPIRRRFISYSLTDRLSSFNVHLTSWVTEYIYIPLKEHTKNNGVSLTVGVCAAMLWYSFSAEWLAAGLTASLLMMLHGSIGKLTKEQHRIADTVLTKLFTAVIAAELTIASFARSGGIPSFKLIFSESNTDMLRYLFSASVIPLMIGLLTSGSLMPAVLRRTNDSWMRIALPVAEILLLLLCSAFMIHL